MNWYKLFYLMTMADRLQDFFHTVAVCALILTVISIICMIASFIGHSSWIADGSGYNEREKPAAIEGWLMFKKYSTKSAFVVTSICIIFWFLYIATPSKKDALLIVAGGAVGTFITSDSSTQRLPADITNFLRAKIIAETKELDLEGILPQRDTLKAMTKEQLIELIRKEK